MTSQAARPFEYGKSTIRSN